MVEMELVTYLSPMLVTYCVTYLSLAYLLVMSSSKAGDITFSANTGSNLVSFLLSCSLDNLNFFMSWGITGWTTCPHDLRQGGWGKYGQCC